jgi:hypothetical protein
MTTKNFPTKIKPHLLKLYQPPPFNHGEHPTYVDLEGRFADKHHIK